MSAEGVKTEGMWSSPGARAAFLVIFFVAVELIGWYARWPLAARQDRYLLQEEDGRNYNLTIEMAKSGDLAPTDLSVPTLGFYLRQPVVWASYYFSRARGEVSTLEELQTRDPYGPSGLAFAVSHPTVLRWNRMFSVGVSLIVVALTFALSFQILQSPAYAFVAALIPALSPELLRSSYLIGGEILMIALCLACTLVGVRAVTSRSRAALIVCAVLAGLAGAAEYRGLWSVVIPISVWIFGDRLWPTLVSALGGCLVGFLLGNPYALFYWEAFLQGIVSAHMLGSAESAFDFGRLANVDQASLFLGWLLEEGVGIVAGGLAAASSVYFVKCFNQRLAVFVVFPVFYLLLVFVHEADFIRAVMVLVPYVAVMASCGLHRLSRVAVHPSVKVGAPPSLTALMVIQLGIMWVLILRGSEQSDSRDLLVDWLRQQPPGAGDIAVAGSLQVSEIMLRRDGVHRVDPATISTARLLQDGFTSFVTSPVYSRSPDSDLVRLTRRIPGRLEKRAIPDSPVIDIYTLRDEGIDAAVRRAPATLFLRVASTANGSSCSDDGAEFCWVSARRTAISVNEPTTKRVRAIMTARSLWDNQEVVITTPLGTELYRGVMGASQEWREISFPLPAGLSAFNLTISRVHQRKSKDASGDAKRAGMAIRRLEFKDQGDMPASGLEALLARYPEEIRGSVVEALSIVTEEFSPVGAAMPQAGGAGATTGGTTSPTDRSIYDVIEEVSGDSDAGGAPSLVSGASASEDAATRSRSGEEVRRSFLNAIVKSMEETGEIPGIGGIPNKSAGQPGNTAVGE